MDMDRTCGETADATKVSMSSTRSMGMVCTSGLTDGSMKATGPSASNTDKVSMFSQMERLGLGSGRMESGLNGFPIT